MPSATADIMATAGEPTSTAQHHRTIERAAKTADILAPFAGAFDSYTPAASSTSSSTATDSAESDSAVATTPSTTATTTTTASTLHTYCKWKAQMDARTLKWAFRLAEANVGPFYKAGPVGWHPKQKQADLNKNWARYAVLEDRKARRPVAYAMFRFDLDYGCSVLYCYELQIERDYQRQGIGRFLIGLLERCARHYGMEKLILTVLSNNANAIEFFTKMGFTADDTSPTKAEATGYEILSKRMD